MTIDSTILYVSQSVPNGTKFYFKQSQHKSHSHFNFDHFSSFKVSIFLRNQAIISKKHAQCSTSNQLFNAKINCINSRLPCGQNRRPTLERITKTVAQLHYPLLTARTRHASSIH